MLGVVGLFGVSDGAVQDLIDEADIGRSTFYSHYTGKEYLLRSSFQTLRTELLEAQRAAAATGASNGQLGFSLAMFEHAEGYKGIYRALVGGRGSTIAITEIRKILVEIVRKEVPRGQSPVRRRRLSHDADVVA